ncbi:trypsin-like peptidase domain-containing protein [Streptomyces sp. NBC_00249]|uniref:S1C family serine protease n=1 Tax=Streptomyces sp. NBC_00249 TaxID=2975690 RepID=UPI002254B884|nr:trypsin-like peptidase domain-containing protein [Streptomyces sp. NBC_00249]MCX5194563.1 trypsin-like peptidase domain-containing protein [Streptomyces sp. NBC_00249]
MSDSQQTDPPRPSWWSRPAGAGSRNGDGDGGGAGSGAGTEAGQRTGAGAEPGPGTERDAGPEAEARTEDGTRTETGSGAGTEGRSAPGTESGTGVDGGTFEVFDVPPGPGPRYDPWADRPLQVADEGRPRRAPGLLPLLAYGVVVALLAGVVGGYLGILAERRSGTRLELPQTAAENKNRAPDSVAGIAATALPGVVTLHVRGGGGSGTGTGFVLDEQGHILTNNHVVAEAKDITVTFSTGESVAAELVGRDGGYDLAVVKVTGVRGLRPLALGNSENVQVGDPVVAIGAPFDLSNTVTAGIISATGRPITAGGDKGDGSDVSYVDALQTDAPINPGNSGGPLLDSRAHVIGINSAIRGADKAGDGDGDGARQSGSIGLGFAIPVNQGKRVAEELIRSGHATHPVIGVTLDMQYTGDGARVGAKAEDGKASVVADGPGARAGIKAEDVITKVDGVRVHGGDELIIKIRAHRPGDRLTLTVLRDGRERTLEVVLGSADGS